MADHGEVEYATATGDDYASHETTYQGFVKLVEVSVATIAAILVSLALIGVKDSVWLGVVMLIAAHVAAAIGLLTAATWRAPWPMHRWKPPA